MQRLIFHVDVNSAFLSWSALQHLRDHPGSVDLRTVPSAVGGDVETRHGVITAKSIPAKKYGITTGEPVIKALQKCPDLILVRPDFPAYRKYSKAFLSILGTYTDTVEQASIDEAYLDMTGPAQNAHVAESDLPEWARKTAAKIKDEIRSKLGFTVNVGISVNKLLAKTASDFTKPDRVHTLWPSEVPSKMWPMAIDSLHGCGRATAEKLKSIGIHTIGDGAHADPGILQSVLGEKAGTYIFQSCNGISESPVRAVREEAKGYSNETTTAFDIDAGNFEKAALPIIAYLAEKVSGRLQRDSVYGSTIGVSVKTEDFRRHSRQTTLPASVNDRKTISQTAEKLLRALLFGKSGLFDAGHAVRLIGISVTHLDHGEYRQVNLFDLMQHTAENMKNREREDKLRKMQDSIRQKYGKDSIHRGPQKSASPICKK